MVLTKILQIWFHDFKFYRFKHLKNNKSIFKEIKDKEYKKQKRAKKKIAIRKRIAKKR